MTAKIIQLPSRPERDHNSSRIRWWEMPLVVWGLYLLFLAALVAFAVAVA
jgi:hypothetical protein